VLAVGCGRGVGSEVILDRLDAGRVSAFDLDESTVELARRRLHDRPVSLSVGDVWEIDQPSGTIDTVVDFGIIHHVPNWQDSIAEIARVLRPGGLMLFEELPRRTGQARTAPHRHNRTALWRRNLRRRRPQVLSYSEPSMPFMVSISCCWVSAIE
jgi:2-polyprenyl-3-methyl-5-hydroxy-6-metoxy-1,4-benzoquinol methylase